MGFMLHHNICEKARHKIQFVLPILCQGQIVKDPAQLSMPLTTRDGFTGGRVQGGGGGGAVGRGAIFSKY